MRKFLLGAITLIALLNMTFISSYGLDYRELGYSQEDIEYITLEEGYWTEEDEALTGLVAETKWGDEDDIVSFPPKLYEYFVLKNKSGMVVAPYNLRSAEPICDGKFVIIGIEEIFNTFGVIDTSGQAMTPLNCQEITYIEEDQTCIVETGYMDTFRVALYDRNMKQILPYSQDRIQYLDPGFYKVGDKGIYSLGEGYITDKSIYERAAKHVYWTEDGEFINPYGDVVLDSKEYGKWDQSHAECIIVYKNRQYALIDGNGNYLLPFSDSVLKFKRENPNVLMSADEVITKKYGFDGKVIGAYDDPIWNKEYDVLKDFKPEDYNLPHDRKSPFWDVIPEHYYFEPVIWAVNNNITSGTSEVTFSPHQTCTRAQILTFLWKAVGCPEPNIENPFSDITSVNYYYKPALWAYEKGMVSGNCFAAITPCTRGDSMTYIWKAADKPVAGNENKFVDVVNGTECAAAVAWALEQGITAGTSQTTFGTEQTCTRAQIMAFLYRTLK